MGKSRYTCMSHAAWELNHIWPNDHKLNVSLKVHWTPNSNILKILKQRTVRTVRTSNSPNSEQKLFSKLLNRANNPNSTCSVNLNLIGFRIAYMLDPLSRNFQALKISGWNAEFLSDLITLSFNAVLVRNLSPCLLIINFYKF